MDQVREVGRSITVEIPILNNNNSRVTFGDNETGLDNVLVTAIGMLPDVIGVGPSGRALLFAAEAMKGYLTLAGPDKVEYFDKMPLELLLRTESILHIKPRMISLRNSFVDLPLIGAVAIPAGPPAGFSLVFTFFYLDFNPDKQRINGMGELEYL